MEVAVIYKSCEPSDTEEDGCQRERNWVIQYEN